MFSPFLSEPLVRAMTDLPYITFDRSFLAEFPGLGTGRAVQFNTCQDKFLLLRNPTGEEWEALKHDVFDLLFRRRMQSLEVFRDDRHILRAFDWQSQHRAEGAFGPFLYLKRDWFLAVAREFKAPPIGKFLSEKLAKLSRGEQLELWERVQPSSYKEAQVALNRPALRKQSGLDFESLFNSRQLPEVVNRLIEVLKLPKSSSSDRTLSSSEFVTGREFKAAAHAVLALLWTRGILLYTVGLYDRLVDEGAREHGCTVRPGSLSKVTLNRVLFAPELVRVAMRRHLELAAFKKIDLSTGSYLPWFLLSSDAREIGDVSPDLLNATRGMQLRSYKWLLMRAQY